MELKNIQSGEARPVFRQLAGMLAVLIFLIGLPVSIYAAFAIRWDYWFLVLTNVIMGIDFACIAKTGRQFGFRKSSNSKDV